MAKSETWFVAVVTPNTEKSCKDKLDRIAEDLFNGRCNIPEEHLGDKVQVYVPIQRELHEWPSTGKRVWVDRVLCPCYIFIRSTDRERYHIACKAKYIHHFLMDPARKDKTGKADFARIPDDQMRDFMRMVGDAETPVTIEPSRLHVGSKVRIKSGRMAGLEGYIYRNPTGSTMLALRVNMLGYATMEFPIALLELVEE